MRRERRSEEESPSPKHTPEVPMFIKTTKKDKKHFVTFLFL
jgi:hypothetical protein